MGDPHTHFCRWRQPTMISRKSQEFFDVRASCRKRHMVLFPMMLLFRDLPRKYGSNVFLDPSYSLSSPSPTYSAIKTSLDFFSRKVFISSLGRQCHYIQTFYSGVQAFLEVVPSDVFFSSFAWLQSIEKRTHVNHILNISSAKKVLFQVDIFSICCL